MLDENVVVESAECPDEEESLLEKSIEPKVRLITFQLENEVYGVEVCNVREILLLNQSFPVPGAPHFVMGITKCINNY